MKGLNFVMFVAGATIGAATAWYYAKKKYELIAQEEIDSVKETFARMNRPEQPDEPEKKKEILSNEKPDIVEYAKHLTQEGYTNYSAMSTSDNEEEEDDQPEAPVPNRVTSDSVERPYVISPDQFNEFDDYTVISLMYYADNVLADDDDERVEDVDDVVGIESLDHFGEYDDDCVYVRNDRLKVDYEILRSLRTYSEVIESKPYLQGDR